MSKAASKTWLESELRHFNFTIVWHYDVHILLEGWELLILIQIMEFLIAF